MYTKIARSMMMSLFSGANANRANDSGYTALIMSCYPPEEETRYLNAKTDICTLLVGMENKPLANLFWLQCDLSRCRMQC